MWRNYIKASMGVKPESKPARNFTHTIVMNFDEVFLR
jgi:hypothetical protein